MKKQLLSIIVTIFLANFVTAQSISFTSATLTTAEIGSTITVNYQYTSTASAGNIYCAINLLNDWTWVSEVAGAQLNPAPAGTNVTGSFQLTIPSGTTPTANLTGTLNYKINIELKNGNVWLAGAYPPEQINLTAPLNPTAISFTSAPLTTAQVGTTIPVSYQYSISNPGKIYCAIELLNGFTYQSTVADAFLDPVVAGNNVAGTVNLVIPPGITPTASLASGFNYKIKIELLNATGGYLAGQFPTAQINFTTNLSTSDFDKNTISVYPNPSNDIIYIKGIENRNISQVSIVDILGKNVFESAEMKGNKIDISNLNTGIYILSITSDNKQEKIKFIKK